MLGFIKDFDKWFDLLVKKLDHWWISGVLIIPNLILAILVMIAFYLTAKLVKKISYSFFHKITKKASLSHLIATTINFILIVVGMFVALDILQLDKAVTSLLAGAGILGLTLGFAFQDLTANFISGIFLAFKKPFDVGDTIETNGLLGIIEDVELRSTVMRTYDGLHIIIPNKDIFQKSIINYSLTNQRRVEFEFSISVNHDLQEIESLTRAAVEKIEYIDKEKDIDIFYTGFGDNLVKLMIRFWIYNHKPPGYNIARHQAIKNIVETLSSKQISLLVPVTFNNESQININKAH
jgi:small conductance mechanosensitive channel